MKFLVRIIVTSLAALGVGGVIAQAPKYPSKPITLVVPFSPGGGADVMARLLGKEISADLGVSVVVINRPGASGNVGTAMVMRSPADGYTVLFSSTNLAANGSLYKNLPYDPIRDVAPIAQVASGPNVLTVNSSSGIKNVAELVARAKNAVHPMAYGSAGQGAPSHVAAAKFAVQAGFNALHVPFKGSSDAQLALASGTGVEFMLDSIPASLPFINSGKTTILAVSSGKRFPAMRDVPTLAEAGIKGYEFVNWWGFAGPKDLPVEHVALLEAAIGKALKSPEIQARFATIGVQSDFRGSKEFGKYIADEINAYAHLVSKLGIRPE